MTGASTPAQLIVDKGGVLGQTGVTNQVFLRAQNSAGTYENYGRIDVEVSNGTAGSATSVMDLVIMNNGGATGALRASSSGIQVLGGGVLTATTCNCPSDRRFKRNIADLPNALETISRLRGVHFDWRCDAFSDRGFDEKRQIGLIAQETLEVVPEVVRLGPDGYYAVDYARLTPVLVEAVKDLKAQNELLSSQNAALHRTVEDMAQQLAKIEARLATLDTK